MKLLLTLILLLPLTAAAQSPTANAGPDRSTLTNEAIALDGTASTNAFDGQQADGRHSIRWDFGFSSWTYNGALTAPIAYPRAGVYTVTLTVCNSVGTCATDTAQVTVTDIPSCAVEVTISDTGNPLTNLTNLQAEIDSSTGTDNKCINLVSGTIYRGTLILKHRTVTTYLTIRTSAHASLPNSTTRVSPSDATNMPKMEITGSAVDIVDTPTTSSTPARYYRFLGIHFRKATASAQLNEGQFVWLGKGNETSLSQLTNHIGFDRCYFDGGTTTSDTWRGIRIQGASDVWIVNSYLYRFKGVALEAQAILMVMGERLNVMNNYLEASTENFMSGGTGVSITNHNPSYMVFRRNYFKKYLGWCATCGSYDGTDMVIKNWFELKTGKFISIQGNLFEDYWQEDQFWALAFTVRGENGGVPWAEVAFVDFSYNKCLKASRGVHFLGSDDGGTSGTVNHFLMRHVVWAGMSFYSGNHNTYTIRQGTTSGTDRLFITNTSTDQNGDTGEGQGRWIEFDNSTAHTNLVISGNIGQGYFIGLGGTGTAALNTAAPGGNWTVEKNGFYRSFGSNPTGNTTVATLADVKYTNISTFNLKLANDSPFLTTGFSGGRSGPDTDTIDSLTSGAVTGSWNAPKCNWHANPPCL